MTFIEERHCTKFHLNHTRLSKVIWGPLAVKLWIGVNFDLIWLQESAIASRGCNIRDTYIKLKRYLVNDKKKKQTFEKILADRVGTWLYVKYSVIILEIRMYKKNN